MPVVSCCLLAKDFLLSEEQADWCGKLYGVCILHKPSDMLENMFKKAVENRWGKRAYEFQGKAQRQYTSTFAGRRTTWRRRRSTKA